ncbi:MAG: hypothetical protein KH135_04385 [Firmicutes bacterium]|nr:hypothetical protein [Bacillota bacterium]
MNRNGFQGKDKTNNYFEGWYFKFVTGDEKRTISLIPSISLTDKKLGYLQVLDSEFQVADTIIFEENQIDFPEGAFIKLGDNWFDEEEVHLNMKTACHKYVGILKLTTQFTFQPSTYAPTIMGPFSYLKNMQCNHGLVSLKSKVDGFIMVDGKRLSFQSGTCYIEKDYGSSFPDSYLWLESHHAKKHDATIFLSRAHIPFPILSFTGLICVLRDSEKQYTFATWNGAKSEFKHKNGTYQVFVQKRDYKLTITWKQKHTYLLNSPKNGKMDDHIKESLMDEFKVVLKKKEQILFQDTFSCGSSEIFKL